MHMHVTEKKIVRERKICLTQIVQRPRCTTAQLCDCILIKKISTCDLTENEATIRKPVQSLQV